jgi:serine phosphatase RsbU (regulator of sigma subunit)
LEVLAQIRHAQLDTAVIMMTAFGSERIAVEAMRHGADDYLAKPFQTLDFESVVERTVQRLLLTRQNAMLRRRLEQEMAQAAQVQTDLLPQSVPNLRGFEVAAYFQAARVVSGDFYDWRQEGQTLTLTLGDVMGKGRPAALLMATVRATMRVAGQLQSPAQALRATAEALGPDLERSGRLVTLFHGQLHAPTRQFVYTNAGHRLGFVRRAGGGIEPLAAHGLPLGVWPDADYDEATVHLRPGDLVVIHSDGLLDANRTDDLREEDLAAVVDDTMHARAVIDALLARAVPEGELPDDLTLLTLRCQPYAA